MKNATKQHVLKSAKKRTKEKKNQSNYSNHMYPEPYLTWKTIRFPAHVKDEQMLVDVKLTAKKNVFHLIMSENLDKVDSELWVSVASHYCYHVRSRFTSSILSERMCVCVKIMACHFKELRAVAPPQLRSLHPSYFPTPLQPNDILARLWGLVSVSNLEKLFLYLWLMKVLTNFLWWRESSDDDKLLRGHFSDYFINYIQHVPQIFL